MVVVVLNITLKHFLWEFAVLLKAVPPFGSIDDRSWSNVSLVKSKNLAQISPLQLQFQLQFTNYFTTSTNIFFLIFLGMLKNDHNPWDMDCITHCYPLYFLISNPGATPDAGRWRMLLPQWPSGLPILTGLCQSVEVCPGHLQKMIWSAQHS